MNQEQLLSILRSPHVSEKAMSSERQYVFKVAQTATKKAVKLAVQQLFNVVVQDVQILNVKGKPRRFGQIQGRRKDWKKAYVRLAEGSEIEMAGS